MKLTKEQVNKKYKGKYVSFNKSYDYNEGEWIYTNIKSYASIRENTTLGEDVGGIKEYKR